MLRSFIVCRPRSRRASGVSSCSSQTCSWTTPRARSSLIRARKLPCSMAGSATLLPTSRGKSEPGKPYVKCSQWLQETAFKGSSAAG